MIDSANYLPKKRDLVWFRPNYSSESQIQEQIPGLVVSKTDFNRKTRTVILCPITNYFKELPTRYTLPEEVEVPGQVLVTKLHSLDSVIGELEYINRLPIADMARIDQLIAYIF